MAFSKIAGFDVTPPRPSSSTYRFSSPSTMILRRMKSSQTDCPYSRSAATGLATEVRDSVLDMGFPLKKGFRGFDDGVRLEPELVLQFFQRRRGAERFHADDVASRACIPLPAQDGGLLNGHAGGHGRRQHGVAIIHRLLVEEFP